MHDFDKAKFFEGCLPIEVMAHRGVDTLRFGPMKPVGLTDPRTGREPYACVQLRQDNLAGDHFSLVGFQTQMKWGEQARVLRLIPGLEQAEFVRFGMVHRNTYINGPTSCARPGRCRPATDLFFAGQMSGVEGYVESAASGLIAGRNAAALVLGPSPCASAANDRHRRARVLRLARQSARTTSRPTSRSASWSRSTIGRRRDAAPTAQDEPQGDAKSRCPSARSPTLDALDGIARSERQAPRRPQPDERPRSSDFLEHLRLNRERSRRTRSAPTTAISRSSSTHLAGRAGRRRAT